MNPATRHARRVAGAFLTVPILCLCGPFLFTSRHLVAEDFRDYYGPHAAQAREEFRRSGELPRWNPWQFAGTPFLGSGQNNFYYPPNALFLALPAERAFGILVAFHLMVAAAGMYRLARSWGLGRDAAVVSGLAFGMSFSLVARISVGHLPHFATACLAPVVLLSIRRAVRRPDLGTLAGAAVAGALPLLAGYPHFVYQLALLAGAVACRELLVRRRAGQNLLPAVGVLAGGAAGALMLAAVHLLPLLDTAGRSNRAHVTADLIKPFHDFDPSQLVLLTVPRFFWRSASDPWLVHEKAIYLGILPLILVGWAFRSSDRGAVRFLAGLALVALGEALTGAVLGWLPWYGAFRLPERVLWVPVLCLSLLAGFGWQRLREEGMAQGRLRGPGIAALASLGWALLLAFGCQARAGTLLFLAAAAGALAAWRLASRWPYAAAFVVALDLGVAGILEFRTAPPELAAPAPWYDRYVGPDRASFRVLDLTTYKAMPVTQGYRLLRGYSHPVSPVLAKFYAGAWEGSVPALDTLPSGGFLRDVSVLRDLNVRWIVAGSQPWGDWKAIAAHLGSTLYEDPGARPMSFLVGTAGSVEFTRESAHRIRLRVNAERAGSVVLCEEWAPGWSADRDGTPVAVGWYRDALMKLDVPPGASSLLLTYAPAGWRAGGWIGAAALFALAAGAIRAAAVRLRRPV